MLYVIAIVCPPLAALIAGKPKQAVLNLILTVLGYLPGLIHAFMVIHSSQKAFENMHKANDRS